MSVYEQFFGLIPEEEKAYEAPEDLASAASMEAEALDAAAEDVRSEGADEITESDVESNVDESGTEEEPVESEEEQTEDSDIEGEEPVDDSEISAEGEEYVDEEVDESLPEGTFDDPEYEYDKKLNVFENTKKLLDIVTQNKESFDLRFGKGLSPELAKEYRLIDKNFTDFIKVAETVLATKFSSKPYNILVKYYVSLTKVYDIIIRMTDNFVTKYNEEMAN